VEQTNLHKSVDNYSIKEWFSKLFDVSGWKYEH